MYTFQTVKLSLEAWRIIDALSQSEGISISEAIERLVRHGSIRLADVMRTQDKLTE